MKKRQRSSREANFQRLYSSYKRRAAKRGAKFELTPEQFKKITKAPCIMCGAKPKARYMHDKSKYHSKPYIYNGVDRFNSQEGYVEHNVGPCCWPCNDLKGRLSLEEFLQKVSDIYHFQFGDDE